MTVSGPRSLSLIAASVPALIAAVGHAGQPRNSASLNGADAQFRRVLEAVERNQLNAALTEVDRLIARHPNFRLAHLVRGDLLLARARPIELFGNTGHAARERLDELRAEAYVRLRADNDHPAPGPHPPLQQTRKRQYWVMEDGRWKIAYEAPTRGVKLVLPESFPGRS